VEGRAMSKAWLKMIGVSKKPSLSEWKDERVHFRKGDMDSIHVKPGDKVVLYACGGAKRIFAVAEVTSKVQRSGRDDWPYMVEVKYSVNLRVMCGVPLAALGEPDGRDLLNSIKGSSYISLSDKEYARAVACLEAKEREVQTTVSASSNG
jgi:hypothetical protein